MTQTAKIFKNGRSQAVRLPAEFRFDATEVFIRRDPATGDVILSQRPPDWESFFALAAEAQVPENFLDERERNQGFGTRDPFEGWQE
jgi:antitoxin VapB